VVRFGFVMEQTLGHVTHHQNLARWVAEDANICPVWMPIETEKADLWNWMPVIRGNWSLKSSFRARDELRDALKQQPIDALFIHTQTVALRVIPFMKRIPTIISLDATPLNYDTVGKEYGHSTGNVSWLERRKYQWNKATFHAAAALVTWCQWAKDSLVQDYGVAAEKVTVIPPGVDMARWTMSDERRTTNDERPETKNQKPKTRLRLLFVGGDFPRKGGPVLLEAFRRGLHRDCTLDIVTKTEGVENEIAGMEGVRVHRGLTANSAPLRELYARADIFVFPTLGDCLPIAVMEAMAAGLPVVATGVGALREEVEEGVNGLVIPPKDAGAVVSAVRALAEDGLRRHAMSRASRQLAEERFDAQRNYGKILELMKKLCRNQEY
jgi:glycosyltransferase involved in cell wall biosynthesis